MDHFAPEPDACILLPTGERLSAASLAAEGQAGSDALAVIGERTFRQTLSDVLAAIAAGKAFRIDPADALPSQPDPGPVRAPLVPWFQTRSSGSTGQAKIIIRSQASWCASFRANARLLGICPDDRLAVLGRLQHSLSLYAVLEALNLGAELHGLADLRPDRQRAALARNQATVLYATPAQIRQLGQHGTETAPFMRLVLVGGGKLDAQTRRIATALFPKAVLREFYGAAETSFVAISDTQTPDGAVGHAYPGVEIRIRQEAGQDAPPGVPGEIWVRSPYLFHGLAAGSAGDTRWQDGYLSVGEIGALDETGALHLLGRKSRAVNVADKLVFPEEMEVFLKSLPDVEEALVLPAPDVARGHVLAAFLYPATVRPANIQAACLREYGPLLSPKSFLLESEWARLAAGKTDIGHFERKLAGLSI